MRRYRLPLIVVLAALVIVIGLRVREATDSSYRTQAQLRQVAEEHLFYPGSVVLGADGADRQWDILGQRIRAYSRHTLSTSATEKEVFAFYDQRLSAGGWRESGFETSLSTIGDRGNAYRRGNLLFQVTILRKEESDNDPATISYQTRYSIMLRGDMPK